MVRFPSAPHFMSNPEYENLASKDELKNRDESGFSEKQIDINIETGAFRKSSKKVIFEKKRKK